jgi:hydrogenase expression/formation protein HypE
MHELIRLSFAPSFGLHGLGDAAVLAEEDGGRLALTTDSYVVSPLFFPGGDIGELAVNGTVNDLAMAGARPLYLTAGFIIEEGFPLEDLARVVDSMARAAEAAGVRVVAGDTKVVERGKGDGLYVNTAGVGRVPPGVRLSPARIRAGDGILVSGPLGRHGVAVMAERTGLAFEPAVLSDTAPLAGLADALLSAGGEGVRIMRDPTRGGLATTLKEFALESALAMRVEEALLPVPPGVRGACELLGLDPFYVANEGILVAVVAPDVSEYVLEAVRGHPLGAEAVLAGRVLEEPGEMVLLATRAGGSRLMDMLEGEQLPRIC